MKLVNRILKPLNVWIRDDSNKENGYRFLANLPSRYSSNGRFEMPLRTLLLYIMFLMVAGSAVLMAVSIIILMMFQRLETVMIMSNYLYISLAISVLLIVATLYSSHLLGEAINSLLRDIVDFIYTIYDSFVNLLIKLFRNR